MCACEGCVCTHQPSHVEGQVSLPRFGGAQVFGMLQYAGPALFARHCTLTCVALCVECVPVYFIY